MDGHRASGELSKSCILIIVVASVERFAYKGVASNLVTYLTEDVKMRTSAAAKTVNSWCGVTSMLPLVGAFLADSYWDRYSTILASSLLYILGLSALTSRALSSTRTPQSKTNSSSSSLFFSLYIISVAQGGYNPCLQAFGADQLENVEDEPCNKDGESPSRKSLFFRWWYLGICSGSLLGVTIMSYIQDTYGWGWGFAIPTIAMAISVLCFSCGSRFYLHKQTKVKHKPIEKAIQAIKAAARKLVAGRNNLPRNEADLAELELQEKPLKEDVEGLVCSDKNHDNEEIPFYNVKAISRVLPVWTMLLMFAIIFQQPATFFTKQGMTMKRNMGNFIIPPATLQSAITISIISLMPLYDKLIAPIIRMIARNDEGDNVLPRMGIGMFLSIVAMVIAALTESKRLEMSKKVPHSQSQGITVPMSIFWLLPQYVLLGVSDVFTVVGMQEFFYSQVPSRMRSIGIALYLSVFGVGSFLSALLISLIELITSSTGQRKCWFSDDMREARIDNYYWILVILGTMSFLMFIAYAKHYSGKSGLVNENGR